MLSSRVRVPAKDELDAEVMLSPACQGLVCAVPYAQSCAQGSFSCAFALPVTDQKQMAMYMIIPANAAALDCGYQSYSKSSRGA